MYMVQPFCIASTTKKGKKYCGKDADRLILIGNKIYPICDECYKFLGKIHQLILEDWEEES